MYYIFALSNFSDEAYWKKGKCQKICEVCCRLLRTIPRTRPLSPAVPASFKNESPDPKPPPVVCTDHHYHRQGRAQPEDTRGEKSREKSFGEASAEIWIMNGCVCVAGWWWWVVCFALCGGHQHQPWHSQLAVRACTLHSAQQPAAG